MTKIYLRFSKSNSLIGGLIRWWTNCPINHVELYIPESNIVVDANYTKGVRIEGAGMRYNPDHFYYYVLVTPEQLDTIQNTILAEVGKPYDWKAIFSFFTNHDRHNKRAWICSELVAYGFEEAGCDWFNDNLKYQKITPRDIYIQPALNKIHWHDLPGINSADHTV